MAYDFKYCMVRNCDFESAVEWIIANAHPGAIDILGWQSVLENWRKGPKPDGEDTTAFYYKYILDPDQQVIFKLTFAAPNVSSC